MNLNEIEQATAPNPEVVDAKPSLTADPVVEPAAKTDAPAPSAAPEAPAFVPDFKYKFQGKEKEIDPLFHPLIKDAETNKKIREILEKSEALELHKGKSSEYQTKLSEMEPVVKDVARFQEMFVQAEKEKNPEKHLELLEELGYSQDLLKDVVRQILRNEQLPDEAKALRERNRNAELEKREILSQNESVKAQYGELLKSITAQGIDMELGKADHQNLVKAYEATNGAGSFKDLFLQRGAYYVNTEGRHVEPSEVMSRIAKEFAPFMSASSAGTQAAPSAPAGQVVREKVKTIPQVGSGSGSPTQNSINSIEDLRRKAQQMSEQE